MDIRRFLLKALRIILCICLFVIGYIWLFIGSILTMDSPNANYELQVDENTDLSTVFEQVKWLKTLPSESKIVSINVSYNSFNPHWYSSCRIIIKIPTYYFAGKQIDNTIFDGQIDSKEYSFKEVVAEDENWTTISFYCDPGGILSWIHDNGKHIIDYKKVITYAGLPALGFFTLSVASVLPYKKIVASIKARKMKNKCQ